MKVLEVERGANDNASISNFDIKRIIVAVDLSPHSERTAAYAAEFARNIGASVILLHVFPPEPSVEFGSDRLYEIFERNRRLMVGKLTKLAEQVRQTGVRCDYGLRLGDPAEQITRTAQDLHADLVIVAAHHPGFLGRFFGLDQAPRVLHRASCPVLVYHEGSE
jgi:nucleotide-binding universal stress UspA family protein